jgi:hypothetical protein
MKSHKGFLPSFPAQEMKVKAFIFHPAVKEIKNAEGQIDITTL